MPASKSHRRPRGRAHLQLREGDVVHHKRADGPERDRVEPKLVLADVEHSHKLGLCLGLTQRGGNRRPRLWRACMRGSVSAGIKRGEGVCTVAGKNMGQANTERDQRRLTGSEDKEEEEEEGGRDRTAAPRPNPSAHGPG